MISPYNGLPTRQLDGGNTTGQIENRFTAQVSETEPVATETKVEWRQNQRKRAACTASTARRKARTSARGRRGSPRYGLRWFCLSRGLEDVPHFSKEHPTASRQSPLAFDSLLFSHSARGGLLRRLRQNLLLLHLPYANKWH